MTEKVCSDDKSSIASSRLITSELVRSDLISWRSDWSELLIVQSSEFTVKLPYKTNIDQRITS